MWQKNPFGGWGWGAKGKDDGIIRCRRCAQTDEQRRAADPPDRVYSNWICNCTGSNAHVCRRCLDQQLFGDTTRNCEFCGTTLRNITFYTLRWWRGFQTENVIARNLFAAQRLNTMFFETNRTLWMLFMAVVIAHAFNFPLTSIGLSFFALCIIAFVYLLHECLHPMFSPFHPDNMRTIYHVEVRDPDHPDEPPPLHPPNEPNYEQF